MRKLLLPLFAGLCLAAAPAAGGDLPAWAEKYTVENKLQAETNEVVFSDPSVWKFGKDNKNNGFLELNYDRKAYKSSYTPKHRSPVHIAILRNYPVTDFVLDMELQSTTEPYDHQDLCLFFGFQSPEKYYYVHIAKKADMNAHNVFIVNAADRKNIAKETTKGVEWKKDTWHKVRLLRQGTTGTIEVYFDDLTKPIMKAEDKTFGRGYVGFGSFDDTGRFRNLKLHTDEIKAERADFFKPLGKQP
jgi:hypothetical protein